MDTRRRVALRIVESWFERALVKSCPALEAEGTNLPLREAGVTTPADVSSSLVSRQADCADLPAEGEAP